MNINDLEQATRRLLRGGNADCDSMLKNGTITPAEHRSLGSLSAQIASNFSASNAGGGFSAVFLTTKAVARPWA